MAYFYDNQTLPGGAPTFSRGYATGRLVAATYGGGSAGNYAGFDALGRTLRKIQQTDSINYLVEASYNVSGAMTSETYPNVPGASDRRTVTYGFDTAGRLGYLNSNATSYAPLATVTNMTYASHGAVSSETYGNGLVHAATYNNRLQVGEIKLGTSGNPTSILDLTYSYGTTGNNGNVLSVNYAGGGLFYTQSFTYDSLNRLSAATELSGPTQNWSQTNGYDRYGNRWIALPGGGQSIYCNTSDNRITGWSYDASGNLLNDGVNAFSYDAEGHIKTVNATTAYVYDGGGARVKKLVGENTRLVYGIGGQLIAEFDGVSGNLKKEYISGGITIEPTAVNSNGTQYSMGDHLGSPRVITNSSGSVVSRHDYMTFGGELFAGTGGRTTGMGFGGSGDNNRKKFTQKERDNETGLDYFLARYYSSAQGRFTSPDGGPQPVGLVQPQSWNAYSYVFNNPLVYVDDNGRWPTWIHELIIDRAFPGLSDQEREAMKDGSLDTDLICTLCEWRANEHGMSTPGQTAEEAVNGWNGFINSMNAAAYGNVGFMTSMAGDYPSFYYFGKAAHALSDAPSPTHGFQVYAGPSHFLGSQLEFSLWLALMKAHMDGESQITDEQLHTSVGLARENFGNVYGEKELARATGRAGSWGPPVGLFGLGTMGRIGNGPVPRDLIAVVTVHPDRMEIKQVGGPKLIKHPEIRTPKKPPTGSKQK